MLEQRTRYRIENEALISEWHKAMVTEIEDDAFRYQSCYRSNVIDVAGKTLDLPLNKKKNLEEDFRKKC